MLDMSRVLFPPFLLAGKILHQQPPFSRTHAEVTMHHTNPSVKYENDCSSASPTRPALSRLTTVEHPPVAPAPAAATADNTAVPPPTFRFVVRPDFLTDVCWARLSSAEQSYVALHGPHGYAAVLDSVRRAADTRRLQQEEDSLRREHAQRQARVEAIEAELDREREGAADLHRRWARTYAALTASPLQPPAPADAHTTDTAASVDRFGSLRRESDAGRRRDDTFGSATEFHSGGSRRDRRQRSTSSDLSESSDCDTRSVVRQVRPAVRLVAVAASDTAVREVTRADDRPSALSSATGRARPAAADAVSPTAGAERDANARRTYIELGAKEPVVTNVSPTGPDPFTACYNAWPLNPDHWEEVFSVSRSFNTEDPPLWTPLVTEADRRQAFAAFTGMCLNCGQKNHHNMRQCTLPFTNSTGLLNPELGELHDNGDAFHRWQRRMQSYRRGNNLRAASSPPLHRRPREHGHRGDRRRHDTRAPVSAQGMVPHQSQDARHDDAGHGQQHRQQPQQQYPRQPPTTASYQQSSRSSLAAPLAVPSLPSSSSVTGTPSPTVSVRSTTPALTDSMPPRHRNNPTALSAPSYASTVPASTISATGGPSTSTPITSSGASNPSAVASSSSLTTERSRASQRSAKKMRVSTAERSM